ncbi:MAG: ERF family protein, partial [Gammaproteobacteria bacterium]|nr:ERF family protein [Gammaproteobacteria bacterium]NIT53339.1 ERF family protein [candidate division Zixibacteria bacterium]NIW39095.1 hypothetical protein [candidate division Zixibacteria bacterium]
MNIDNLERNAELRNNLLSEAICKMQRELEAASKDESNPFFNSKYANLEAVVAACREPLFKNGLSVTQHLRIGESPYLETVLRHKSGEFITSECPLLFQKQDMQAMGSAITYARRYALAAICGIV